MRLRVYFFWGALLPLLAIALYGLRYHQNIFSYYLPNSQWNDEVIYFKTVEGILKYGIPQGFFGYNESHAIVGTFGAWSPLVYVIDTIWGFFFGWNFFSPIFARVFFSIIALVIYSVICKPNFIRIIFISLFIASFSVFSRNLASQMVDSYIVSLLIIFIGFYEKKIETLWPFLSILLLVTILTLIRPYFSLLFLVVTLKRFERKIIVTVSFACLISIAGYFFIYKYMTAEYFQALINLNWLRCFGEDFSLGIKSFWGIINVAISCVNENIKIAFTSGNFVGGIYFLFYLLTIFFCYKCIFDKKNRLQWGVWFVINVILWFSIVLFYDVMVGSRHLIPFIIMEFFILVGKDLDRIFVVLFVLVSCFIFYFRFNDPYYCSYPSFNSTLDSNINQMNMVLTKNIEIVKNDRWDNTILWVFSDIDGSYPWQSLYALPAGMGINICTYDYIIQNFANLKAKYIACTPNGDVSSLCDYNGYNKVVFRSDIGVCIYEKK